MNKGTLATIVAINVVVSAVIVVVALNVWTPESNSGPKDSDGGSDRSADADVAKIKAEMDRLSGRMTVAEGKLGEVADLRADMKGLRTRVDTGGVADGGTTDGIGETAPKLTPEEEQAKLMQEAMAAMMARGARMMGPRILEMITSDSEEARAESERRASRDAQRLARRIGLDPDRTLALTNAFVEVDGRIREDLKRRIEAKGAENVTYDDIGPAIDDSFEQRERAAETILTPTEMKTYKSEQDQQKTQINTMLKTAFPPPADGSGK